MNNTEYESSFFQSQYAYFDGYGEQKSPWEPLCDAIKIENVFDSVDEFLDKDEKSESSPYLLRFQVLSFDQNNDSEVFCTLDSPYSEWVYLNQPEDIDGDEYVSIDEFNLLKEKLKVALSIMAGVSVGSFILLAYLTSKVL